MRCDMSECTHDCSTCSSNCKEKKDFIKPQNKGSNIKRVIAVVSGKGGVGKSMMTSLLATAMRRRGEEVAILDADITGPSIPQAFGLSGMASGNGEALMPMTTDSGIKVMSLNLLLPDTSSPVVWRGPVIAGAVLQFWQEVAYGEVDYMFVDCPPGTGDVPLTVFQSLPVSGIIMVTSPQDLVSMIVEKAIGMARLMNVPILGIVENYSYLECPDCGKRIEIFGKSKIDEIAKERNIPVLARLPINPKLSSLVDDGRIEEADTTLVEPVIDELLSKFE